MSATPRWRVGKKRWNRRVARVIDVLRTVVEFDHLYIGGGNAKHIKLDLPHDVSIVPNSFGLTGGFALWRASMRRGLAQRSARLPGSGPHGDRLQPRTAVAFDVPEGACDCHVHVSARRRSFRSSIGAAIRRRRPAPTS